MAPQQGLMRKGFLDPAGHPVVGVDHALCHGLVDLQGQPGDQRRDVPVLVQLSSHLEGRSQQVKEEQANPNSSSN